MESQYAEVDETDERQRLKAALVECLLDEWMLSSDVCLSPLLGFAGLDETNKQPEIDEDEGGVR